MGEIDPRRPREDVEQELAQTLRRLQRQPDDFRLNVMVGHLLCALHQHEDALLYYKRAASIDPGNPDAWYAMGIASAHSNQLDTAEQCLRRAIELGRNDGIVRASLASVLQRNQRPKVAIQEAFKALEFSLDPVLQGRLKGLIGACLASLGDYEGALVHLQDAVAANPDIVSSQHNLGVAYIQRGNCKAAVRHFAETARLAPDMASTWYDLGRAARVAGELDRAREALERALALGFTHGDVHLELAQVFHHLHQEVRAARHARRALRTARDPRDRSTAYRILAHSALQMGLTRSELRLLRAATESDPSDSTAHYALGYAYWERDQYESARSSLRRAAELDPDNGEIWRALGMVAIECDDQEEARHALEAALRRGVDDVGLREQLAWIYRKQEAWEQAIQTALPALDQTDDLEVRTRLHRFLSACYDAIGDAERDLYHLQEAVRGAPDDAELRFLLAAALYDRGEFFAALPHLETATSMLPDEGEYRLTLARTLMEVARCDEAAELLERLLESDLHEPAHLCRVWCDVMQERPAAALARARREAEARPESALAWAGMALALFASSEDAEARAALERARALAPGDEWVESVAEEMAPPV